jgi:hypothetical protein
LNKHLGFEGYGAYDFEFNTLARAGVGLSWRTDTGSLNLSVSRWRNPFDQRYLVDKGRDLPYWGLHSESAPSTYRDVRLSGSYRQGGWGFRGTLGVMAGVRTGWTASSHLTAPSLFGFVGSLGIQAVRSGFTKFYVVDGSVACRVGCANLQVKSQVRRYSWRGQPSSLYTTDGSTEISVDFPISRHFRVGAAAGGDFRELGNEGFRPRLELRLITQA